MKLNRKVESHVFRNIPFLDPFIGNFEFVGDSVIGYAQFEKRVYVLFEVDGQVRKWELSDAMNHYSKQVDPFTEMAEIEKMRNCRNLIDNLIGNDIEVVKK